MPSCFELYTATTNNFKVKVIFAPGVLGKLVNAINSTDNGLGRFTQDIKKINTSEAEATNKEDQAFIRELIELTLGFDQLDTIICDRLKILIVDALGEEVGGSLVEIEDASGALERARDDLAAAMVKIQQLNTAAKQQPVDQLALTHGDSSGLEREVQKLKQQLEAQADEQVDIELLTYEVESLRQQRAESEAQQAEVEDLKQQLAEAKAQQAGMEDLRQKLVEKAHTATNSSATLQPAISPPQTKPQPPAHAPTPCRPRHKLLSAVEAVRKAAKEEKFERLKRTYPNLEEPDNMKSFVRGLSEARLTPTQVHFSKPQPSPKIQDPR